MLRIKPMYSFCCLLVLGVAMFAPRVSADTTKVDYTTVHLVAFQPFLNIDALKAGMPSGTNVLVQGKEHLMLPGDTQNVVVLRIPGGKEAWAVAKKTLVAAGYAHRPALNSILGHAESSFSEVSGVPVELRVRALDKTSKFTVHVSPKAFAAGRDFSPAAKMTGRNILTAPGVIQNGGLKALLATPGVKVDVRLVGMSDTTVHLRTKKSLGQILVGRQSRVDLRRDGRKRTKKSPQKNAPKIKTARR